jgi:hypothetical protein
MVATHLESIGFDLINHREDGQKEYELNLSAYEFPALPFAAMRGLHLEGA